MIAEKKISCRLISGGKKSCKEIYDFACRGKKFYHQRFGRNKFILHKPNHQYLSFPLEKSNGWPVSNGT